MKSLKISREIELILAGIGAVQSLYLSLYIFLGKKKNIPNLLIGSFFVLITIRIIKSLLWLYVDEVPDWFLNIGFIAHLTSGLLLFLYFGFFTGLFKKWKAFQWIHFIPVLIIMPYIFQVDLSGFWHKGGYTALLYHQLIYTCTTAGVLLYTWLSNTKPINVQGLTRKKWRWLVILMIGAGGIQLAYFSNYILGIVPYVLGPMIYGCFIYVISIYAVINHRVFDKNEEQKVKYGNISIEEGDFDYYKNEILRLMEEEQPFTEHTFSLEDLSRRISLPYYLTSHIINKGFDKNFSVFINSYRIELAKSKLRSKDYKHIKISEIAYQSGFNTLSSFNSAFKKETQSTPSAFRNQNL